jgi:membrane fusion protein (multidrug efflux system)
MLVVLATAPAAAQQSDAAVPAVEVVRVAPQDVTPTAEFVGRVEAVQRADLRARVTGFLDEQRFTDGARVTAGDVLFVIEQDPFAAEVQQAEANLEAARAEYENAAVQLARAEELVQNNNIPRATVDERRAAAQMAQAAIAQAEAGLTQARITYSYTEITSPIDGRVGRAAVKVGNLVSPESGVLATVVQQDPVYVTFNVAERQVLAFRRDREERGEAWGEARIELQLRLSDGTIYEHDGTLDFADVQVNPTTDTLTLRGTVPNPDGLLIDNQFVTVVAFREEPTTALTVPVASVQLDQQGSFVLVVDDDDTVAVARVVTGEQIGQRVIVEDGLEAGDRVVVGGIMKVRPGMTVRATPSEPTGS